MNCRSLGRSPIESVRLGALLVLLVALLAACGTPPDASSPIEGEAGRVTTDSGALESGALDSGATTGDELAAAYGLDATTTNDDPLDPERPWTRSLLYRVEGSGGTVYLMGTMHLGVDLDEAPADIDQALDESSVFVMETDISEARNVLGDYMHLPEGESLREKIGDEAWAELQVRLPGADTFDTFRPWFVTSMLLQRLLPTSPFDEPLDQALHARAAERGYELGYLEPVRVQFDAIDEALDAHALAETLLEWDEEERRILVLRTAFVDGDIEGLHGVLTDSIEDEHDERTTEILIDRRNESWIPVIETYLEKGDAFIAFGAGHLPGPKGVIALLEAAGHTVERVEPVADE